tara:strand:- start:78 stop:185 length:108 start_codon:yes stop_codon:yes gene_type:complete
LKNGINKILGYVAIAYRQISSTLKAIKPANMKIAT